MVGVRTSGARRFGKAAAPNFGDFFRPRGQGTKTNLSSGPCPFSCRILVCDRFALDPPNGGKNLRVGCARKIRGKHPPEKCARNLGVQSAKVGAEKGKTGQKASLPAGQSFPFGGKQMGGEKCRGGLPGKGLRWERGADQKKRGKKRPAGQFLQGRESAGAAGPIPRRGATLHKKTKKQTT